MKTIFSGPLSEAIDALGASLSAILIPVLILAVVVLADYATGLMKAQYTKQISSDVGYKGVLKKLAYIPIVLVGIVTDWVVQSAMLHAGLELQVHAIALILILWQIAVECISILENIAAMGTPVPGFLLAIVSKLKNSAEAEGSVRVGENGLEKAADLDVMTKVLMETHRPEDGMQLSEEEYHQLAELILTGTVSQKPEDTP